MSVAGVNSETYPAPSSDVVDARSLEGLHSTVPVPPIPGGFWKNWRAFIGPAFLVSVGYMDPGNWATDLKAGARFKYDLLWVVAASSFMAVIMQILSARLGVVTGKDLAQACRDFYPKWSRIPNWLACEAAIAACDLAEVLGSAIAINMLFPQIELFWAVCITACDVMVLLALQGMGMRFIEALILVLVATIGGCYFAEIFILPQTHPNFAEMGSALARPGFRQDGMIVVAIGIIGATVMPHNLYLHSALVQSRRMTGDVPSIRRAIRFNTLDVVVALSVAFLVNAAILVLGAMTFFGRDAAVSADGTEPDWIKLAHETLSPLLGVAAASVLFAVALLASGQSSTITGTMAGQVVMEGFLHWKVRAWVRRLATRLVAIVPALVMIGLRGDRSVTDLLVLSQVILATQLPLAMFPLLHFTSSRKRMGQFRNGWFLLAVGWTSCLLITALDIYALPDTVSDAWKVIVGE